jgi:tetratricopeptide (TPR) repeat protein
MLALATLLPAGAVEADQNDARLDDLFLIMQETEQLDVVAAAESQIWQIWLQHDNIQTQTRLAEGVAAIDKDPYKALLIFNALIEDAPNFAEIWNKRATLFYLFGEYEASAGDIAKTLELEPRHFGALSGLGLVYLAQDQLVKARSAFEAVLLVHPHSSGVRQNIEMIDRHLQRSAI